MEKQVDYSRIITKYSSLTIPLLLYKKFHENTCCWYSLEAPRWKKAKGSMAIWSQNTRKPQTRLWQAWPQKLIVRYWPSETFLGGRCHLICGKTHHHAIKEGSKAINHNLVNNHACSLSQIFHTVTCLFVASINSQCPNQPKNILPLFLKRGRVNKKPA